MSTQTEGLRLALSQSLRLQLALWLFVVVLFCAGHVEFCRVVDPLLQNPQWLRIAQSMGFTRLGASLPEDGGRTGFRNVAFEKFRRWTNS